MFVMCDFFPPCTKVYYEKVFCAAVTHVHCPGFVAGDHSGDVVLNRIFLPPVVGWLQITLPRLVWPTQVCKTAFLYYRQVSKLQKGLLHGLKQLHLQCEKCHFIKLQRCAVRFVTLDVT